MLDDGLGVWGNCSNIMNVTHSDRFSPEQMLGYWHRNRLVKWLGIEGTLFNNRRLLAFRVVQCFIKICILEVLCNISVA